MTAPSCVIVGAGCAGLSAAWWLSQRGIRSTVLEAAAEPGGRARTHHVNDVLVNTGASFFTTFYSETLKLTHDLGLSLRPSLLHPGLSGHSHKLATPVGLLSHQLGTLDGFLRFPAMTFRTKIRALATLARLVATGQPHIADLRSLARYDEESAESWGRRAMGDEGYEYVVRPALEPFFYFGAEQCSASFARAVLRHAVGWRPLIPQGGVGELCRRLAAHAHVRYGSSVAAITPQNGAFLVSHDSGVERATDVVIAVPADKALAIDAPMSERDRSDLAAVRYLPCVRAILSYPIDRAPQVPYITPAGPGRHPVISIARLDAWEPGRVPSGAGVIWISASGWRGAELMHAPAHDIIDRLREDCATALGTALPPPAWAEPIISWQGMVVPTAGHFRRAAGFLARERAGIYFAGDWLTGSTVEGAVRTGRAAAAAVCARYGV